MRRRRLPRREPAPDLKADTDVFTTFEGDNTVLLQLVAQGPADRVQECFHELGTLGKIRFGAGIFTEALLERTSTRGRWSRRSSPPPRRATPTPPRGGAGPGRQLELFQDRERHLLEGVALRLQRAIKADDQFAVFNDAQDHLIGGRPRPRRPRRPRGLRRRGRGCPDPDARALLRRVCDLYALTVIEANRGWYLEHERLAPVESKQVIARVNALCAQLRPHARDLVDGFGIPDAWLGTELLEPLPGTVDREPAADPAAVA